MEKKETQAKAFLADMLKKMRATNAEGDRNKRFQEIQRLLRGLDKKMPMVIGAGIDGGKVRAQLLGLLASSCIGLHKFALCKSLCEEALYNHYGVAQHMHCVGLHHWASYHRHEPGGKHTPEACPNRRIQAKAAAERKSYRLAFRKRFKPAAGLYRKALALTEDVSAHKRKSAWRKAEHALEAVCREGKFFFGGAVTGETAKDDDPRYMLARSRAELAFLAEDKKAVRYARGSLKAYPSAGTLLGKEDWGYRVLVILGEYKEPSARKVSSAW